MFFYSLSSDDFEKTFTKWQECICSCLAVQGAYFEKYVETLNLTEVYVASPLFLIQDLKIRPIVCISLVHDCIRLFSFVHLLLFYVSLGELGRCCPHFLILNSKIGSIVCISLVHDCICVFSFVHLLLFFYLFMKGLWTCYPPFLILDSKMSSIVCISLLHDCMHLFSFVLPSFLLLSSAV